MADNIIRPQSRQKRSDSASLVLKWVLFDVWQRDQEMYDGSTKKFEVLKRKDTVIIVPVLNNGELLFIQEEQPGMKPMLRTIGWRVEEGESPEEAVRRELLEETGYTAQELRLRDAWQPLNKTDWAIYLFVAHWLSHTGESHEDWGEKISLHTYPIATVLDGNADIAIDDNEFLFKLYHAQANQKEHDRVVQLLTP